MNPWEPVESEDEPEPAAAAAAATGNSIRAQLPATPTEVDPDTGKPVATTAQGVRYWYREYTAMGIPIAPEGYPGETAGQEVTSALACANVKEKRMALGVVSLTNGVVWGGVTTNVVPISRAKSCATAINKLSPQCYNETI